MTELHFQKDYSFFKYNISIFCFLNSRIKITNKFLQSNKLSEDIVHYTYTKSIPTETFLKFSHNNILTASSPPLPKKNFFTKKSTPLQINEDVQEKNSP